MSSGVIINFWLIKQKIIYLQRNNQLISILADSKINFVHKKGIYQ
jgi:hypothetical protein